MAKFKASARTLDLLGRQQIAGIPTAINELFKNAHDAYADNVEIDFFRKEKTFVLRDNGLGMTRNDFEQRWLTLGTESKFSNRKIPAPPKHPDKPERPMMGEKGIGRLAVASIGNQVLVITRAERKQNLGNTIAAYIHWGIFELPGLSLDDITIPLLELPGTALPSESDIEDMKKELTSLVSEFIRNDDVTEDDGDNIIEEISSFHVSPTYLHQKLSPNHFQGNFDEFGQFNGVVRVYNEKEFDHRINWTGNNYGLTACGPFSIDVAYIQGSLRQSTVDAQNHARISAKADKYGGLYIYKYGLRILPYGDSNYDFIDIEKNRTKSASYYFFSYRRMYGVIDITRKDNAKLREKAGREGFIENKAYRQLREILKNFFVQLAADFFREGGGPKSEFWAKRRQEQEKVQKALEKRDRQAKARKEKFLNSLNSFFENQSAGKHNLRIEEFLAHTQKKIDSVAFVENQDEASQILLDYELEARQELDAIKQELKINRPRGFAISKDIRRDYEAYLREYESLEEKSFSNAENQIENLVTACTNRLEIKVSKRRRLEQAINFISEEAEKATRKTGSETKKAVSSIASKVKELTVDLMTDLENKIREVKDQFKHIDVDATRDFDLVRERKRMEEEILGQRNRAAEILEGIIKQLDNIYWEEDPEGNVITNTEMTEALEQELYELRERVYADVELSQLELAVGIIQHEFNSTINSVRKSIRELKAWTEVDESLEGVYNNIRIHFEHLDGYLTLLTPLNRRLYRTPEDIPAKDILVFLIDLFKARLERHSIKLKHTKGFSTRSIYGLRSVFYPVFVNVVDNAIHWLSHSQNVSTRVIRLHADDSGFYISNNGPKIDKKDQDVIFDFGFTRKPNGRGMGLHISREVLESVHYRIFVDEPRPESNVTFKIESVKETDNE